MRPSAALAILVLAPTPAFAGHFDDVIDPNAKPIPCTPDTTSVVPNCPSNAVVADATNGDSESSEPPDPDWNLGPDPIAPHKVVAQLSRDDEAPPVPPPPPDPGRIVLDDGALRWIGEVALGFDMGTTVVDGTAVTTWPSLNLGAGIASGRFSALATYTLTAEHYPGSTTANNGGVTPTYLDTDGIVHRVGLAGRYSFAHATSDNGLLGDIWLQGDGGEEFTRWDRGGLLERPYAGLALGWQGGIASSAHKRHSLYVALRVQVARRSDLNDAAATCSAPCTEATPPERWSDRSVELRLGFAFGN